MDGSKPIGESQVDDFEAELLADLEDATEVPSA